MFVNKGTLKIPDADTTIKVVEQALEVIMSFLFTRELVLRYPFQVTFARIE